MDVTYAIDGKQIEKQFKGFKLDVPEFKIPEGFATALIGENGAGKSTLLNILSGIRLDYKGEITYFGENKSITDENTKERIGYTGTGNYFLPNWTGKQVRKLSGLLFDNFDAEKYDEIAANLMIPESFLAGGKSISKLSDGNKVKLMLACVFARNTRLMLLDEPASPLDPLMREMLADVFRSYLNGGNGKKSILFSTHNISDMETVTDYAIIMENGKLIEQGFVEELKEKYILVKGEKEDAELARGVLLSMQESSYGFEGICLANKLDRLAGANVAVETPTLFQISVAVMKQHSGLKVPVL